MLTIYQILARAYAATNNHRMREHETMKRFDSESEVYKVAEYWANRYTQELEWLDEEILRQEKKEEESEGV